LFYPLVLLAISSNWIFTPAGYVDPWVYYGYFHDLVGFKNDAFLANHYYGSRLSWILPGYVVHRFFNPETASIVLHLAVYYLAVFALYFVLKHTAGRRGALTGSLLLGGYAFFLTAAGWDYLDGAGIAYCLLSLAFLTAAAVKGPRAIRFLSAGAAAAAMVHANLLCLVFCPLLGAYWVLVVRVLGGKLPSARASIAAASWFMAGAVMLSAVLAGVNYAISGAWLFFLPSIRFALQSVANANPWAETGVQWIAGAKWLVLPAGVFVSVAVSLLAAWRRRQAMTCAHVFGALFAAAFLMLLALEAAGSPMLQLSYYASYLIPWLFLTLGAVLAPMLDRLTRAGFGMAVVVCVAAFPLPLWGIGLLHKVSADFGVWLPLALALLLAPAFALRNPGPKTLAAALFALCACHAALAPFPHVSSQRHAVRPSFRRIARAAEIIRNAAGPAEVRFWFDQQEQDYPEFLSLNSTFIWGHRTFGMDFPALPQQTRLDPGTVLVVPSARNGVLDEAQAQLRPQGLDVVVLNDELLNDELLNNEQGEAVDMPARETAYRLYLFRVVSRPPQ
jgi:hypothetical protein